MPLPEIIARVRVVLGALPARLAALAAVLTVVAVEVVPLLPGPLAAKVAAWIASVLGAIAFAVRVIARLTEVPDEAIGLVLDDGQQLRVELVGAPWPAGHVHPGAENLISINTTGVVDGDGFAAELRHVVQAYGARYAGGTVHGGEVQRQLHAGEQVYRRGDPRA